MDTFDYIALTFLVCLALCLIYIEHKKPKLPPEEQALLAKAKIGTMSGFRFILFVVGSMAIGSILLDHYDGSIRSPNLVIAALFTFGMGMIFGKVGALAERLPQDAIIAEKRSLLLKWVLGVMIVLGIGLVAVRSKNNGGEKMSPAHPVFDKYQLSTQ